MNQYQLNFEAEKARDIGIQRAVDHANKETPSWSDRAVELFLAYCQENKGANFMTEDVRWYAEALGLPEPPDKRAWGAIAVMAKRRGLIRSNGYAPQKAVNAHCAPKTVWVALWLAHPAPMTVMREKLAQPVTLTLTQPM